MQRIRAVTASLDPALGARITSRRPLVYSAGADISLDRPAIVRAASGITTFGSKLAVVQDDASFVALVDPVTWQIDAITLPAGPSGVRQFDDLRGNKADKLDLEACVTCEIDGQPCLLAFGSGSTAARERVAVVPLSGSAPPRLVRLRALYGALRSTTELSDSELNIEGAVRVGDRLRLFQRGNGAPRGALHPLNATVDVPMATVLSELRAGSVEIVPLERLVVYDLGSVRGVPWTFTDATVAPDGRILFAASAEDSPDATRDGPVLGAALGILDESGAARFTELSSPSGAPVHDKVEGVTVDPRDPRRVHVVIDADDPARASELWEVELSGSW